MDAWTVGLGATTEKWWRECKTQEDRKRRDGPRGVSSSVLDCCELNNLTVIDLHVMRSAVHLINVVADFKNKGHFTTF